MGVPRVWEKFKEVMERVIKDTKGVKEVIMQKARVCVCVCVCVCAHVCICVCVATYLV